MEFNHSLIETYINKYHQFILLFSGLDGCNKIDIANSIAKKLDIPVISYIDYIDKNDEIQDWNYDNIIKWEELNKEINDKKEKGVVIVSPVFISENMKFICDLHIAYYMNKQYLKNILHKKYPNNEEEKNIYIINHSILPYYYDITKKSYFNKSFDMSQFIDIKAQLDTTINYINDFFKNKIDIIPKQNELINTTSVPFNQHNNINQEISKNKSKKSFSNQKTSNIHHYTVNTNEFINHVNNVLSYPIYGYFITPQDYANGVEVYEYNYADGTDPEYYTNNKEYMKHNKAILTLYKGNNDMSKLEN